MLQAIWVILHNADTFLINNCKNAQIKFMIEDGLIDEIPDQYKQYNEKMGEYYSRFKTINAA